MNTMKTAVTFEMPNTTMAVGIHAIGAIGARTYRTGDRHQVAMRERLKSAPVKTAATKAIDIPANTRKNVETMLCDNGTAWDPRPMRKPLLAMAEMNRLGGGST